MSDWRKLAKARMYVMAWARRYGRKEIHRRKPQDTPESIPTDNLTQRVEALEQIHKAELEVLQWRKNNKEGNDVA